MELISRCPIQEVTEAREPALTRRTRKCKYRSHPLPGCLHFLNVITFASHICLFLCWEPGRLTRLLSVVASRALWASSPGFLVSAHRSIQLYQVFIFGSCSDGLYSLVQTALCQYIHLSKCRIYEHIKDDNNPTLTFGF